MDCEGGWESGQLGRSGGREERGGGTSTRRFSRLQSRESSMSSGSASLTRKVPFLHQLGRERRIVAHSLRLISYRSMMSKMSERRRVPDGSSAAGTDFHVPQSQRWGLKRERRRERGRTSSSKSLRYSRTPSYPTPSSPRRPALVGGALVTLTLSRSAEGSLMDGRVIAERSMSKLADGAGREAKTEGTISTTSAESGEMDETSASSFCGFKKTCQLPTPRGSATRRQTHVLELGRGLAAKDLPLDAPTGEVPLDGITQAIGLAAQARVESEDGLDNDANALVSSRGAETGLGEDVGEGGEEGDEGFDGHEGRGEGREGAEGAEEQDLFRGRALLAMVPSLFEARAKKRTKYLDALHLRSSSCC